MRTTSSGVSDQGRSKGSVRTGRSFHPPQGSSVDRDPRSRFGGTAGCFKCLRWSALALPLLLGACQTTGQGTLAELRNTRIEIKEAKIQNVPEKAMESYRHFLEVTPASALKPEAIRRLADLKVEKESGLLSGESAPEPRNAANGSPAPGGTGEGQEDTGNRAVQTPSSAGAPAAEGPVEGAALPEGTGAREAIQLYTKLLNDYPNYDRSDQVLYQMSRAYEQLGQVDEAMQVMDRLVREHPGSRYIAEVQFRRGEYFFTRRQYRDAEEAYGSVVAMGASTSYFPLALYKLGWSLYKQERYDKALDSFLALLDHKVAAGIDIARPPDEAERKRIDDTFRAISLSFSNLGGSASVVDYFARNGRRSYEDSVYSNLAEFYFDKHRYSDAATTYSTFIDHDPFHTMSPRFQVRVIEIQLAGGFPSLAVEAKKEFARRFGVTADYWRHFEQKSRPEVLAWLKTNLTDLAKHYHALYQSPKLVKDKAANFEEAEHWYREFLASFPADPDAPAMNYLLADLYLENRSFDRAAVEYEKTAYEYPRHEKSSQAGYAAVYAWRQHLAGVAPDARAQVYREIVRSSIEFAVDYPEHEKAAIVLGAAADDLYDMRDYELAAAAARSLIVRFPGADRDVLCQAWLVVGHASYELSRYQEAERAYAKLLKLLPPGDARREGLTDNLAAAIYKQGEEARARGQHREAAAHFLRVGSAAPASRIRANAEYDGAASLIEVKDWMTAVTVLKRFRTLFPGHALQPEVTKKLAYVYRETGAYAPAADEYERIERESTDENVRREALLAAAEMYEKAGQEARVLAVYRRSVELFPHPAEPNLELRDRIAAVLKKNNDQDGYQAELAQIVAIDAAAGSERTPRTRALAANAALVLAEQAFDRFAAVKLVEPLEANLNRKKELMKAATQQFNALVDYEIGDVTAAATYYLAEIYADFSRDLKASDRPAGLSAMEREEYELAIEDQAYPFEEKAIATHQNNLELISRGVYNGWIEKSLRKLAVLFPARYDKPEMESPVMTSSDSYVYALGRAEPSAGGAPQAGAPQRDTKPADAPEAAKTAAPEPADGPAGTRDGKKAAVPGQAGRPEAAGEKSQAEGPLTTTATRSDTGAPR
jgi:TolA-binding protein